MREMLEGRDSLSVPAGVREDANQEVVRREKGPIGPDSAPRSRRRVILGIRDLVFHQEVLDHLERDSRVEVVAAVTWPGAFLQGTRELAPDVAVACPEMIRELRHPTVGPSPNLLIVAEEMTVPVLRAAIDVGARGVFSWPEERAELAEEISQTEERSGEVATARGRVIAVYGTRGGGGTTFVATQLAASLADRGRRCVLVDLDAGFADVTIALGADRQARTIADLIPVVGELTPDHLKDVLFFHPRGFAVLLAPSEATPDTLPWSGLYPAAIALLAGDFEVVLLHVPRGVDDLNRAGLRMADDVVLVVAPDLFSLHAARRAMQSFGLDHHPDKCRFVLNPAVRSQIGPREIERLLGAPPFAVRFDPAVPRAQARSRLLPPRGRRAAKDLRILADKLFPQDAAVKKPPSPDLEES